ncbi:MAG: hypothetical protein HFJ36_03370 [Clostridia bacterium]|nr:hypothetical protein [Clostridia bacterium]
MFRFANAKFPSFTVTAGVFAVPSYPSVAPIVTAAPLIDFGFIVKVLFAVPV